VRGVTLHIVPRSWQSAYFLSHWSVKHHDLCIRYHFRIYQIIITRLTSVICSDQQQHLYFSYEICSIIWVAEAISTLFSFNSLLVLPAVVGVSVSSIGFTGHSTRKLLLRLLPKLIRPDPIYFSPTCYSLLVRSISNMLMLLHFYFPVSCILSSWRFTSCFYSWVSAFLLSFIL
jgi:hypothetical protein